ncbi:MAG: hypothetical protein AAF828_11020 [Bacteroidota bacterium]
MITEATIEAQINRLESGNFAEDLKQFSDAQPYLMDYLSGEDTGAFMDTEQELLFFASLVIHHAIQAEYGPQPVVDGDKIAQREEAIFSLLQDQPAKAFRDRITPFFEQTQEEDLLAFIEDILIADEETGITKEGREPLFVILKTCMEVLLGD